jgi:ribonuclease Z
MVPDRSNFILEIYGPQGLHKFIRGTLDLSRSALTYEYIVHELIPVAEQYPEDWNTWPVDNLTTGSLHPQEKQGKDITVTGDLTWNVFDGQNVCVKAGAVTHRIPSFGFVVTEQDEPGKLDADRLKYLGVPPGPLYGRIKRGEAITLPSGKTLDPFDVLGPPKRGRRVTVLGDTSDSFKMVDLAQSSDVLHEATLENCMEEKAVDMGHSTPKVAAQYAESVADHFDYCLIFD